MTEEQQLINRYIRDLATPTSTAYMLHFLKITKDHASEVMLKDSLRTIQTQTKNEQLRQILNETHINQNSLRNFGRHDSKSEDIVAKAPGDSSAKAKALFSQLKLEDALKLFTKSVHESPEGGKFYRERAELYLLLNNYKKALSLANKGHCDDIFFAAGISEGNFSILSSRMEVFLRIITKNMLDFKNTVISRYEFEVLLVLFSFTLFSSHGLKMKTDLIFQNSTYNHENLKEMAELFSNRKFALFLKKLPDIEKVLEYSMYSSHSSIKFIDAIKENVVINEILPFSYVKLDKIQQDFSIPIEEIREFVIKAIRNKKLNGKLDLVNNVFIGAISNLLNNEIDVYYNRTIVDLQELQLTVWKKQYNKENSLKREQLALTDKQKLEKTYEQIKREDGKPLLTEDTDSIDK